MLIVLAVFIMAPALIQGGISAIDSKQSRRRAAKGDGVLLSTDSGHSVGPHTVVETWDDGLVIAIDGVNTFVKHKYVLMVIDI